MRYVVVGLVLLVGVGGCSIKKERVRGKTQVEIRGGTVRLTAETARVRIGKASARVPVPKVHIVPDSGQRSSR